MRKGASLIVEEKERTMGFGETLAKLRTELGITQEELARELFVTRQAVSRWENGDTTPGIDMLKLIAVTTGVPVTRLLDMPGTYCESCGMILADETQHGTNADGSSASAYCKWCYDKGSFTDEMTMDEMIEDCAPRLATKRSRSWGRFSPRWNDGRLCAKTTGSTGPRPVRCMETRLLTKRTSAYWT